MLINTLFLFLRELLPIFFLLAMLLAVLPSGHARLFSCLIGPGIGLAACLLLIGFIDVLSQCCNGTGVEWLMFVMACLQFLLFLLVLTTLESFQQRRTILMLTFIVILVTASNSTNFVVFLLSLAHQGSQLTALLLGTVIGAGISASLAILLYFLLTFLSSRAALLMCAIITLFFAGHLAESVNLLAQIGLLSSDVLWTTRLYLPDNTELALVLSSLLGYEASPTGWQVSTYLGALCLISVILFVRRERLRRVLSPMR